MLYLCFFSLEPQAPKASKAPSAGKGSGDDTDLCEAYCQCSESGCNLGPVNDSDDLDNILEILGKGKAGKGKGGKSGSKAPKASKAPSAGKGKVSD